MTIYDGYGNAIQIDEQEGPTGYNACEKVVYKPDLMISVNEWEQNTLTLSRGRYAIRLDEITSTDTDADTCEIYFIDNNNKHTKLFASRGENIYIEFDLFDGCAFIVLTCSDNVVHSSGDTATYKGLVITRFDDTELEKYPFWGKKFAFIGDSFTAGYWMWPLTMCNELHAIEHMVVGESGARWTVNDERPDIPCAYEQAQMLVSGNATPDYIYAFLGTNDRGNDIAIGELVKSRDIEDFDLHTVCGGIQACLSYLQDHFPDAVIKTGFTVNGKTFNPNKDSVPYTNAIKGISEWYGVQYMDTLTCGISTMSDSYDDCWQIPGTIDGGHPTVLGHEYIGKGIARKTLYGD